MARKLTVLFSLVVMNLVDQPSPEIQLEQGTLRGRVSNNGEYFEYLGIPYASTNRENRFQAPLPAPHWNGTFNAVDENSKCPQMFGSYMTLGQEDCLKMNIYAPYSANSQKLLPVMVFVHGGGFMENSASNFIYGADFFMRHGVLLVTFNYRLGALGFLSLDIKEAPGNAGLKDQVAALKWVQKNIAAFGGDPNNVTLFGESAGAVSVSYLIQSTATKGLFKRAILQSGSSLAPWGIMRDPIEMAKLLAKSLGSNATDPHTLLKLFTEKSASELVLTKVTKPKDGLLGTRLVFVPCVEKKFEGIEQIISDTPYNSLKLGKYNKVPVIIGFNDKEGLFIVDKEAKDSLKEKDEGKLIMNDLEFNNNSDKFEIARSVKKYYFNNQNINKNTLEILGDVYSDLFFKMPAIFESEMILQNSDQPVYNYYFKYNGKRNVPKFISGFGSISGATHADELFYMYSQKFLILPMDVDDNKIIDRLTNLWTNFAKTSNPTPHRSSFLIPWEKSKANILEFLNIDKNLSMGPVPDISSHHMWKEIYSKYRRKI